MKEVAYESEYIDVLNKAISLGYTLPSLSEQLADNKKIKLLKLEGIWSELDLLYWFKRDSAYSNFSKINWKNPNLHLITTPVAPTFINNIGWQGGGGGYLHCNYTPSTQAVKGLPGNISVFYHQFGFTNAASSIWGTRNGSSNNFAQSNSACQLHSGSVTGTGGYTLDADVLHIKNGATHNKYVSGSLFNTVSYASGGALSTVPLILLGQNLNGTPSQFVTTSGLRYFGLGSKNIESKAFQLNQILNNTY